MADMESTNNEVIADTMVNLMNGLHEAVLRNVLIRMDHAHLADALDVQLNSEILTDSPEELRHLTIVHLMAGATSKWTNRLIRELMKDTTVEY